MNDHDAFPSDPHSLSQMMDLGLEDTDLWDRKELGAMLKHQLAAPVLDDLGHSEKHLAEQLEAADPPIRSFQDLLHHTHPPVEALDMTKRFAKACRKHPDSPLPDEIATVLYFLSIAAALIKCGRRITRMDDQALKHSLEWALRQRWVDPASRELLREGREAI
ncbi:MAG: hypothetical protein JXB62_12675 [Pirellulales bacterium]|nr:hypothetical protein [Pirellulales bacterium]